MQRVAFAQLDGARVPDFVKVGAFHRENYFLNLRFDSVPLQFAASLCRRSIATPRLSSLGPTADMLSIRVSVPVLI